MSTKLSVGSVPPSLSVWLDSEGDKMVAVCRAERGKPAANISWSERGSIMETLWEDGGFFTVERHLELLKGTDTGNLTCIIDHPFWRDQQILLPKLRKGDITETMAFIAEAGILCCSSLTDSLFACRDDPMDHCRQYCLSRYFVGSSFILCPKESGCEVRNHLRSVSNLHACVSV